MWAHMALILGMILLTDMSPGRHPSGLHASEKNQRPCSLSAGGEVVCSLSWSGAGVLSHILADFRKWTRWMNEEGVTWKLKLAAQKSVSLQAVVQAQVVKSSTGSYMRLEWM